MKRITKSWLLTELGELTIKCGNASKLDDRTFYEGAISEIKFLLCRFYQVKEN
jgi:hypothetical protein